MDHRIIVEHYRAFLGYKQGMRGPTPSWWTGRYKRGIGFEAFHWKLKPSARGGMTIVYICDKPGSEPLAKGVAICSWSDNYCYKIGYQIALGRAIKQLNNGG